MLWTNSSELYL